MPSRRDEVEAQRYMTSRVTGAMVRAEPEVAESPTRRDRTGIMASLIVALLMLCGIAIWALLPGSGSTKWKQPRMLIVDASTGARYVLSAGALRPVNDLATATLYAGGQLTPITVPSGKLANLPRGGPLGTSDRPQVLPSKVNNGVWRACSAAATRIVLEIGAPAAPDPLTGEQALPVTADGKTYLLWGAKRWSVNDPWVADVLGLALLTPVPVAAAWLDLVPLAGAAAPPSVPGEGKPGREVAGRPTKIGQMFKVDMGNGASGHYLMTAEGLVALTATEYVLLRARPEMNGEAAISPSELAAARNPSPARLTGLPETPPRPRPAGPLVCVEYSGRGGEPSVVFASSALLPAPSSGANGALVSVYPGGGALLLPPDAAATEAIRLRLLLVDEHGVGYQVTATDLNTLGYAVEQAVLIPPALIALVPQGPPLSRPDGV